MKTMDVKFILTVLLLFTVYKAYTQSEEVHTFDYPSKNLKFDMPADIFVSKGDNGFAEFSNRSGTFRFKFIDTNLESLDARRSKLYELIKTEVNDFSEADDKTFVQGTSAGGLLMVSVTLTEEYYEESIYILFTDPKNSKNNCLLICTYEPSNEDDNPGYLQAVNVSRSFRPINK